MSENGDNKKNISRHILPTSSNLLGLCFVILSFIRIAKLGAETILDELVAIAIIFFLISSVFSYASMRSKKKAEFYEKTADIIFIAGLFMLTLFSVIIVCEVI
jgi:multisubunit Na+/H+ antiporter MnhG subunit